MEKTMYRIIAATAFLAASVATASAQGLPSIWQSERGAIVKIFNIDRGTRTFSGILVNAPTGACPGLTYDLTGRVAVPRRAVTFRTVRPWSSDCAVTTNWYGRALDANRVVTTWTARSVAPNGRVVWRRGSEVFRRI
jgi:hypothetical protein